MDAALELKKRKNKRMAMYMKAYRRFMDIRRETMAIQLGITHYDLKEYEANHKYIPKEVYVKMRKVFKNWRSREIEFHHQEIENLKNLMK